MFKSNFIRSFITLLMLLLLVVANAPRQWMHHLFATHSDKINGQSTNTSTAQLYTLQYHCQLNQIVAESPFTNEVLEISAYLSFNYLRIIPAGFSYAPMRQAYVLTLRGPPAC